MFGQDGLSISEILLPLHPKSWDEKCMAPPCRLDYVFILYETLHIFQCSRNRPSQSYARNFESNEVEICYSYLTLAEYTFTNKNYCFFICSTGLSFFFKFTSSFNPDILLWVGSHDFGNLAKNDHNLSRCYLPFSGLGQGSLSEV